MARIQGPRGVQQTRAVAPNVASQEPLGAAINNLSQTVSNIATQFAERRQRAEDAGFLANITAESSAQFESTFENYKSNAFTSDANFVGNFDSELSNLSERVIGNAKDQGYRPSSDAVLRARSYLANIRGNYLTQAATYENNARVEKISSDIDDSIKGYITSAYINPEQSSENTEKAISLINDAKDVFGGDVAELKKKEVRKNIALSTIQGIIKKDAKSAINILTKNPSIKDIDASVHMKLLEAAVRQDEENDRKAYTDYTRRESLINKEIKLINEEYSRQGDKLLSAGQLTTDWLEENYYNLSDEDYRYFHDRLRDGDLGSTDVIIYSDLLYRAAKGEDVSEEARTQVRLGNLKITDYDKLITRSEKNAGIADLPNWFKRGESYISDVLRVSDINPDPAAAQRRANALDEWYQWSQKHPDPTIEEARKVYQEISKSYSLIDTSGFTLIKPMPIYAVGGRRDLNIEETINKTADAYDNGEITEKEFQKQSLLIQEWEQALRGNDAGQ